MLVGRWKTTLPGKQNESVCGCVEGGCVDSLKIGLATRRSDAAGAHGDDGTADREAALRKRERERDELESATTAVSSSACQALSLTLAGRMPCGRA